MLVRETEIREAMESILAACTAHAGGDHSLEEEILEEIPHLAGVAAGFWLANVFFSQVARLQDESRETVIRRTSIAIAESGLTLFDSDHAGEPDDDPLIHPCGED